MGFPDKYLNRDEESVLDLRSHWLMLVAPGFAVLVAVVAGIAALALDLPVEAGYVIGVAILFALGFFAFRYAQWSTTNFVITTERVIVRAGLVAKSGREIPLEKINTVQFNQRVIERLIGAGDLSIESAGESGPQTFHNVQDPVGVQQEIYNQIDLARDRQVDRIGRASAQHALGGAGGGPSIPEQIAQLDGLRRQGILSEQEFAHKKADLLGRM